MARRFGQVVWWFCAVIGALIVLAALQFAKVNPGETFAAFAIGGLGVFVFALGYGISHVVSGE